MEGTDILWKSWRDELTEAQFSAIAATLLMEEMAKITNKTDAKDHQRRFNRHIRACKLHVRKAERIRRTIARLNRRRTT